MVLNEDTLARITIHELRLSMESSRLVGDLNHFDIRQPHCAVVSSVKIVHWCLMLLLRLNPPELWQDNPDIQRTSRTRFLLVTDWLSRDTTAAYPAFYDSYLYLSLAQENKTVCLRIYCFQLLGSAPPLCPSIAGQNCNHSVWTAPVDHSSIGSQAPMTLLECMSHGHGSQSPKDRCWEKWPLPLCNLMARHIWTLVKKYVCSVRGKAVGRVQSGGHLCLWQRTWCSWLCIFPSLSTQHTGSIEQIRGSLLNFISYKWIK